MNEQEAAALETDCLDLAERLVDILNGRLPEDEFEVLLDDAASSLNDLAYAIEDRRYE